MSDGDEYDRLYEIEEEVYELDPGPEKITLLEEGIREADALNDLIMGYQFREDLVEAATFCGEYEKALVAFTWCLSQRDKDPMVSTCTRCCGNSSGFWIACPLSPR